MSWRRRSEPPTKAPERWSLFEHKRRIYLMGPSGKAQKDWFNTIENQRHAQALCKQMNEALEAEELFKEQNS